MRNHLSRALLVVAVLMLGTTLFAVRVTPAKTKKEAVDKLTQVLGSRADLMVEEANKAEDTRHFGKELKRAKDEAFKACTLKNQADQKRADDRCIAKVASLETFMQAYRAEKARVMDALKSGGTVETIVEEPVWVSAQPNKSELREHPVPSNPPVQSEKQTDAKKAKQKPGAH